MAVGITAGASTPDSVVGDVVEKILALRGHTASELTGPSVYEEGSSELRMMNVGPTELRLTLAPQRRFEAIDVNTRIAQENGDVLAAA